MVCSDNDLGADGAKAVCKAILVLSVLQDLSMRFPPRDPMLFAICLQRPKLRQPPINTDLANTTP